jgi:hypothetical protein
MADPHHVDDGSGPSAKLMVGLGLGLMALIIGIILIAALIGTS